MYYKYNEQYEIIEKSETELEGENIVNSDEDLDIVLFRIIVGVIGDNGELLRYTKFIRSAELVDQELKNLKAAQDEYVVDLDFRLSVVELGISF